MGDIQVTLLIGFFMLISYIWANSLWNDSGFLLSCIRDYGGTVISRSLGGIWKHNGFSVCFDFHFRRRSYENKFYYKDTEASSENWQQ